MLKKIMLILLLINSVVQAKTIIDPLGRTVIIPNNPQKIVAIGPATLRLLTYMQLDDKLIGIEKFEKKTANDKPYSIAITKKRLDSLPVVAPGGKPGLLPNFEKLIKLDPDIIFVSVYSGLKNIELIANKTKIPVVGLIYGGGKNFKNISYIKGARKSFQTLGEIFSKQKRAKELNDGIAKIQADLNSFAQKQTKTVYIGGLRHKGRGIITTDYGYLPFSLIGLKNTFEGKVKIGSVSIQKEALLKKNPDYIFLDVGGILKIRDDMKKNKTFYNSLKAFQNNQTTWLLHSKYYSASLCNLLINSYVIANKLELSHIDIDQKAKEIYKLFFKDDFKKVIQNYYIPVLKNIDDRNNNS